MKRERENVAAIDLRGCQPQGSGEIAAPGALYAVDFSWTQPKNPSELLPALARGQTALGKIDAKNEDDEDEKLSTKPGQLHRPTRGRRDLKVRSS
jgi:hypothetical protein